MRTLLFTSLFLLPALVHAQADLHIVSVFPPANEISAARDDAVVMVFDQPVDPASFDVTSFMVFGRWSGAIQGTLAFEEDNKQVRFTPQRPYSAGEMVTVSIARHLAAASGQTLERGYAWQFWTRPRRAEMTLQRTDRVDVRRNGEGHIQTYGAYAGDFNGDGYTDFAVPNERANDVRMFMNDGGGNFGSFTVYPIVRGAVPSTNEGADFNLDGHLDFAVGNSQGNRVSVFLGDGTGALNDAVNYPAAQGIRGLSVLDLNGDGYADIATANRDGENVSILLNDGDGTFTNTQNFSTGGNGETATSAADFNEDGILDLAVGAIQSQEIVLLLGDGEGRLRSPVRVDAGGGPWMIATGDVNGDGHADVVSANSLNNNASVLLGDGQGNLQDAVTYPTGEFPLSIDLGDLDGDGDLDLVTSNFSGNDWSLYENQGDGTFGNLRSLQASSAASCAVFHDRDNDGALDMTGIDELDDFLFLFTNTPVPTAVEAPAPTLPMALLPNYPNPFHDRTTLTFRLAQRSPVRLILYDVLGRTVRTLVDGARSPGLHTLTWDGLDNMGHRVPAGIYYYRLESGPTIQTRSLLYVGEQ